MTHPDGRAITSDAPEAAIAEAFGAGVILHTVAPDGLKLGFDAGTLASA